MTHASGADSSPLLQESQLPHAACCPYLKSGNRKLGSRNFLPEVIQTTCRKNVSRSEQQSGFRSLSLWFQSPLLVDGSLAFPALPGSSDPWWSRYLTNEGWDGTFAHG